jgi:hypothetical protein
MTGSLVFFVENYCALDHLSGQTTDIVVHSIQIIMDTVNIFLMKDIKNLKPILTIRFLRT